MSFSGKISKLFKNSYLIKDIVIGMSDGLTVPFALAAGLSGAVNSTAIIITAGLAEIAAGSIAMGLGGYLAGKTEVDYYKAKMLREEYEVEHMPESEKEEVREIFADMGLSRETQQIVTEEIAMDKTKWVEFMMRNELGLEKPHPQRARNSALNIGVSYIIGGILPLSPYFFVSDSIHGLRISCIVSATCLFLFGFFKAKATELNPWEGAVKMAITGAIAAAAAFFIARLINH
jgi:VIT1/CCC1 family predicted Fe2+/Mn2+ transporter